MRVVLIVWCGFLCMPVFAQEKQNPRGNSDSSSIANRDTLSIRERDSATMGTNDTLTVIGVGDIMMGTNYPEDRLPPDDGNFLLHDVAPVLRDADVTFGNLEGTLLNEGGTPKNAKIQKYAMHSDPRFVMRKI